MAKEKTMKEVKYWLNLILAVVTIIAIVVGGWLFKRWYNYSFGYEEQVRAEICAMVKPEALNAPCD